MHLFDLAACSSTAVVQHSINRSMTSRSWRIQGLLNNCTLVNRRPIKHSSRDTVVGVGRWSASWLLSHKLILGNSYLERMVSPWDMPRYASTCKLTQPSTRRIFTSTDVEHVKPKAFSFQRMEGILASYVQLWATQFLGPTWTPWLLSEGPSLEAWMQVRWEATEQMEAGLTLVFQKHQ